MLQFSEEGPIWRPTKTVGPNVTQRRTADYYGNCPALCRGPRAYAARGHARLQHPFNLSYKGTAREKEESSSIFALEQSLATGNDRKRYVSFTTLPCAPDTCEKRATRVSPFPAARSRGATRRSLTSVRSKSDGTMARTLNERPMLNGFFLRKCIANVSLYRSRYKI